MRLPEGPPHLAINPPYFLGGGGGGGLFLVCFCFRMNQKTLRSEKVAGPSIELTSFRVFLET